LFWKKLSSVLISWGFKINPYGTCVANKTIYGSQCTILWHVDDLKISQADAAEATKTIEMLSAEFGKETSLTINRRKIHDYLGMVIDYSTEGNVKINMEQIIQNIIDEMPIEMTGVSPRPASNNLFEVNADGEKVNDVKDDFFPHVVAQLLTTAIAFQCTRVQSPDIDDYKKLTRVTKYLRGTVHIPLSLEPDSTNVVK
jgi:hypothetical protein